MTAQCVAFTERQAEMMPPPHLHPNKNHLPPRFTSLTRLKKKKDQLTVCALHGHPHISTVLPLAEKL